MSEKKYAVPSNNNNDEGVDNNVGNKTENNENQQAIIITPEQEAIREKYRNDLTKSFNELYDIFFKCPQKSFTDTTCASVDDKRKYTQKIVNIFSSNKSKYIYHLKEYMKKFMDDTSGKWVFKDISDLNYKFGDKDNVNTNKYRPAYNLSTLIYDMVKYADLNNTTFYLNTKAALHAAYKALNDAYSLQQQPLITAHPLIGPTRGGKSRSLRKRRPVMTRRHRTNRRHRSSRRHRSNRRRHRAN